MFRYCLLLVGLLLILAACVPAGQVSAPGAAAARPHTAAELGQLRERLHRLPNAQLLSGEPLRIRYRDGDLFAAGAALPLPAGSRVLDPLGELLKDKGWHWQGVVRAATDHGKDYDQRLAAGRLEMLQRYLTRRGVQTDNVSWQTRAEKGPSLQLTLDLDQPSPASASGSKR